MPAVGPVSAREVRPAQPRGAPHRDPAGDGGRHRGGGQRLAGGPGHPGRGEGRGARRGGAAGARLPRRGRLRGRQAGEDTGPDPHGAGTPGAGRGGDPRPLLPPPAGRGVGPPGNGEVFVSLGRIEEAQRQFRRAAEIRAALLGPEHPDTLTAEGLLVHALSQEHYLRYKTRPEVEPLARRVLEVRRRVLGPEHPATLLSMTALARGSGRSTSTTRRSTCSSGPTSSKPASSAPRTSKRSRRWPASPVHFSTCTASPTRAGSAIALRPRSTPIPTSANGCRYTSASSPSV